MAYGYLQPGALGDDFLQCLHLAVAVCKGDGEQGPTRLHQTEHAQHLCACERTSQEPVARDGETTEPLIQQRLGLLQEAVFQIVGHSEDEEAVRIFLLNLGEVVVLQAIDKLLYDDGCRHLGIVHVREKHLGRVTSVDDEWRHHLHLFAQEERTPVPKGTDGFPVPLGVLPEPQMAMCIYDRK